MAEKFKDSETVLIADVDCTGTGKDVCEKVGVEGFPTIKYYNPPDTEGEDYEGGRDEDSLEAFAKTLGPTCSPRPGREPFPSVAQSSERIAAPPRGARRG